MRIWPSGSSGCASWSPPADGGQQAVPVSASERPDGGQATGLAAGSDADWLDVVDGQDRVIGRERRGEVHARGLMHRSVHLLLFDSAERLFVQRRSLAKDTNAGLWDTSAAGHVDAGESPDAAAVRELHEELGVRVEPAAVTHLFTLTPRPATGNEFVRVYRAVSDAPLRYQADEVIDGVWLSREELAEQLSATAERAARRFTDVFRTIVERSGWLRP